MQIAEAQNIIFMFPHFNCGTPLPLSLSSLSVTICHGEKIKIFRVHLKELVTKELVSKKSWCHKIASHKRTRHKRASTKKKLYHKIAG